MLKNYFILLKTHIQSNGNLLYLSIFYSLKMEHKNSFILSFLYTWIFIIILLLGCGFILIIRNSIKKGHFDGRIPKKFFIPPLIMFFTIFIPIYLGELFYNLLYG